MSKTEQLKELRTLTQAGMKDCNEALTEAGGDLQKAVDIIKTKGKNIVSGREGKIAAEGAVFTANFPYPNPLARRASVMVEINCQTDFVARSPDFTRFGTLVVLDLMASAINNSPFVHNNESLELSRSHLVFTTKENCVIRRWWIEEATSPTAKVFSYVHAGNNLSSIVTLFADNEAVLDTPEFNELGSDLSMQVAAMNPLAISRDKMSPEDVERQRAIFTAQLVELNKPQTTWEKIIEGKFNKWYSEVCLLEQESIVVPKTSIKQVINNVASKLGTTIEVATMIRCQVGEGLVVEPTLNLADEVAKMV